MTLSYFFLVLIIYSFGGWVVEVIYTFVTKRRFVNHGFLYGPLCPIYGVGAILVITVLKPFSGNMLLLAFMGMVSATALEYATSWVMEKLFHTRWWDYSKSKFNIHGRVCLKNTIAFGVLAVVIVRLLQPLAERLLASAGPQIRDSLALGLFLLTVFDYGLTLATLLKLDKKIAEIKFFADEILLKPGDNRWFDPYNLRKSYARLKKIARDEKTETHDRQLEKLRIILKHSDGMNRLFNSFPKMKNHRNGFSLDAYQQYQK